MLFFCELYVIRDELALLGRTAHHPRSWASTSYNYNRSWASTSYNYNYQLPATSRTQRAAEGICLCLSAIGDSERAQDLQAHGRAAVGKTGDLASQHGPRLPMPAKVG